MERSSRVGVCSVRAAVGCHARKVEKVEKVKGKEPKPTPVKQEAKSAG
jgi:hypothetical protein